jgi:hypothetical protein
MAAFWICLCAFLNCAGWILSALHMLNRTGYAIAFAIGLVLAWRFRELLGFTGGLRFNLGRQRRRFRRFLPAGFAIVAGLAILGGILHPPSNYDALAYRVPRILHWLAAEQWEWVHTMFHRLNTRAAGYEWVAAPLILFTKTDRLLFLINVVSLLLLPGLVFSCYRRLGIAARVAWSWMWILPTGYSFILQAGGIGNDLFGAVFAVASFDFALRAGRTGRFRDVAIAVIAAAMLTGSKTSNIPLVLPCAVALMRNWRMVWVRPVATMLVLAVAGLSSFAPIAWMNYKQCGDWTGGKVEDAKLVSGSPLVTVPGNALILTVQNFVPPVFPWASKWNGTAADRMPEGFRQRMADTFEPSGAKLAVSELQNEEFSGLGMGVSLLLALSIVAGLIRSGTNGVRKKSGGALLRWLPWVSASGYAIKATIGTAARIFTPYYLLLIPAVISGSAQSSVVRRRWWNLAAGCVFLIAALLVIVTPSRPLWPAQTMLGPLAEKHPGNKTIQRLFTVYSVYGKRADALAECRDTFQADEKTIGVITFDDPETSLWRPFGSRRLIHVLPSDSREALQQKGIRWVAVNTEQTSHYADYPFEKWAADMGAVVEHSFSIRYRAGRQSIDWRLVRISDPKP